MVHTRAPGKINVFLKVGTLLEDGYHDVAIAYQAVSLYEDIRAYPADDFSVSVTGTVELSRVPTDASNIAVRAAQLLAHRTGYRQGVRLEIDKHVPVTGGMGGGSAEPPRPSSPAMRSGAPSWPGRTCSPSLASSAPTCRSPSPVAPRSAPAVAIN